MKQCIKISCLLIWLALIGSGCARTPFKKTDFHELIYTCHKPYCMKGFNEDYIVFITRTENEYDLYNVATGNIKTIKGINKLDPNYNVGFWKGEFSANNINEEKIEIRLPDLSKAEVTVPEEFIGEHLETYNYTNSVLYIVWSNNKKATLYKYQQSNELIFNKYEPIFSEKIYRQSVAQAGVSILASAMFNSSIENYKYFFSINIVEGVLYFGRTQEISQSRNGPYQTIDMKSILLLFDENNKKIASLKSDMSGENIAYGKLMNAGSNYLLVDKNKLLQAKTSNITELAEDKKQYLSGSCKKGLIYSDGNSRVYILDVDRVLGY